MIKVLGGLNCMNLDKVNCGVNIVLTHGDMDGLVAAGILTRFINSLQEEDLSIMSDRFVVVASLAPQPDETDKMLYAACKYMGISVKDLDEKDSIWILDRTNFSNRMIGELSELEFQPDLYIADHHISSVDRHNEVFDNKAFNGVCKVLKTSIDNCGTSNTVDLLDELCSRFNFSEQLMTSWANAKLGLNDLVRAVNDWDTFRWKKYITDTGRVEDALIVQSCDKILGSSVAWINIADSIRYASSYISALESLKNRCGHLAYSVFRHKLHDFQEIVDVKIDKSMLRCKYGESDVVISIMFGMEEFQSMLSDYIFENYEYIDIVLWINNSGTISIRSKDESPVASNEVATKVSEYAGFSGGGHKNAAGGRIKSIDVIRDELLEIVYWGLVSAGIKPQGDVSLKDII